MKTYDKHSINDLLNQDLKAEVVFNLLLDKISCFIGLYSRSNEGCHSTIILSFVSQLLIETNSSELTV